MFYLLVACMAGTFVLFGANMYRHHGYVWADEVCAASYGLCSSPSWAVIATIALALVYVAEQRIGS